MLFIVGPTIKQAEDYARSLHVNCQRKLNISRPELINTRGIRDFTMIIVGHVAMDAKQQLAIEAIERFAGPHSVFIYVP